MPDAPLALRHKLEEAIRAYLLSRIAAVAPSALDVVVTPPARAGVASPSQLRVAQEAAVNIAFPRVVLEALRAPGYEDMDELAMVDFRVYLGSLATGPAGSEQATANATDHAARAGLLAEFMGDKAALLAFVNSQTPPVPDLRVYDVLQPEDEGEQTGNHWMTILGYLIPCQLISS